MGTSGDTMGGINCNIIDGECSCFHSVLQCLLMHPVMKICFNKYNSIINNINNNNKYPLTLEIIKIFNTIMQRKTANSSNFINLFRNIFNFNKNKFDNIDVYSINTPGKFLYFLLFLLHNELNESQNNFDINSINNISFKQKQDRDYLMTLYFNYVSNCHKDSIIFQYFFSTEKIIYNCLNCKMYYDCDLKNIFYMDLSSINDYRKKNKLNASQFNANLDECFDYYCNKNNVICQYCRTNIIRYVRIFNGKTLIINFKRNSNNTNRKCDVDFPIKFNFSKYTACKACNEGNMEYVLKGCISYGLISNNNWKYIADVNLDANNNSQGRWIRYIDANSYILESFKRIYDYEPQILIYQLNNLEENINNNNNNNINNNILNNFNNNNQNSGYYYNNFNYYYNNFNNNNNQYIGNMNNINPYNNTLNIIKLSDINFNAQNNPNNNININNSNVNYNDLHGMINNQGNYKEITNTNSLQPII